MVLYDSLVGNYYHVDYNMDHSHADIYEPGTKAFYKRVNKENHSRFSRIPVVNKDNIKDWDWESFDYDDPQVLSDMSMKTIIDSCYDDCRDFNNTQNIVGAIR